MKIAIPTMSQQQYVRWSPHRSPYAIELKLELVPRLISEIDAAEKLGIEVGGVLIGSFDDSQPATLRIEEFELVPRNANDGSVYMLDAGQRQYLTGLRVGATARGSSAVGFFRSHLRPGPLRPSLADRSLLVGQFKDPVYTVLLIQAREPRIGAFFLALDGQLSTQPAVEEFRLDERALRSVREIPPKVATGHSSSESQTKPIAASVGSHAPRYVLMAVLLLIGLSVGIFSWPFLSGLLSSFNRLDLFVEESNQVLRISWNQAVLGFGHAAGASLVIADGAHRRVVQLGRDELKWGIVEYEPPVRNQKIHFTLTVNMPGFTSLTQSVDWQGNP